MRRALPALIASLLVGGALALTASVGAGVPASATPPSITATTFLLSGRGWGHGVGMSQYGALGFANEGRTHEEILGHFYPGTVLGPAPVAQVRVLVAESKPALTVSSKTPFRVRNALGKTTAVSAGALELEPKLVPILNGVPTPLVGPIVLLPGRSPLELGPVGRGTAYRGRIEIVVAAGKLNAINVVGLDNYLAGVVPREMPAAWPAEALKAQAVAARSYALAHRVAGKSFDLYADVRSQVYGAIAGEDPRATAAIEATAGRVLLYEGKPVDALFHSTSGGRTVSAAEAFGTAVPYLVAVPDPHSDLSPLNRWGPTPVADTTIRKGLGIASPVLGLQLVRSSSGRVRSAAFATTNGTKTVTAGSFRTGLGLRSTWITAVVSLSLTRPAGSVVHGGGVTLRADAKGVKNAVLAQRVDGVWTQVAARPAGGAIDFKTNLLAPASFRLSAGSVAGPVLRVPVAPLVKVSSPAGGLEGTVTPANPGATIQIQLLDGDDWLPAGVAVLDDLGAFRADADLDPGTYRVRIAPMAGFAEGLSRQLRIER